jgi:hypothetical protein
MYCQETIIGAIEAASREIEARNTELGSYIRGVNDCFAFVLLYENYLRGSKSLSKGLTQINYRDHKEFLGSTDLFELASQMMFEPVLNRVPQSGDICYEERHGMGAVMVSKGDYWVSTTDHLDGVKNRRKTLFKELRPQILARPVYI